MSEFYTYILQLARAEALKTTQSPTILDYGCGAGEVVRLALDQGIDAYGVDVFAAGGSGVRNMAQLAELMDHRVFQLQDGHVPFPDEKFDAVLSNQVFEHIREFSRPLEEINRVLKAGGVFINIFPSNKVWREGHNGVPFSHWFPQGSKARYAYTYALRRMGLGYNKGKMTVAEWTTDNLDWMDRYTFYKPFSDILAAFTTHFSVETREADYISYRVGRNPILGPLAPYTALPVIRPLMAFVASRLAGHVFVLRKQVASATTAN